MKRFMNTFGLLPCLRTLTAIILIMAVHESSHAQLLSGLSKETETVAEEIPADSLERRTPRGAVEGFINAIGKQNYLRASHYLELNKRAWKKDTERIRIVSVFQQLLDRSGDIQAYGFLSNKETGRTDDDIPEGSDLVGTITAGGEDIDLIVKNTALPDTPPVWQFSSQTVEDILNVNEKDVPVLDRILPEVLKQRKIGGVPTGHWLALVVLVMVSYLIAWMALALISLLIKKIWQKTQEAKTAAVIKAFEVPLRLYLAVWIFVSLSQSAGVSIIVRQGFSVITVTIGIVAFLMLLWRIADLVSFYTRNRMVARNRISAISVILFLRRTAKVAIVIFGIIAILGAIGVDVTAGLAALGIGGIALALGAQKTMENFVGSVTLIADQPVRVGDFCKIGDTTGTVESIGMRSTRIRTASRTIVTIPNGDFSSGKIENYSHRDRFLFNPVFYFRLETTPDQVRFLLVELRALLYSHPKVIDSPPIVRFTAISGSSLKIDITAYIDAPNFDTSQEVQEDLLLRIMEIVSQSGTTFAYPSQTLYMAQDGGTSPEKSEAATATVRQWRENEELQLPRFDPKKVEELKGSIVYPPEGSAVKEDL